MSKKPTLEQIGNSLLRSNFGVRQPAAGPDRAADPVAETPMVVSLEQVRPYDSNPRTKRNPRYDEIKESIRTRGLDQPPPITRRPGESFFIISNGGNTRLAILNELFTETKEEKFRTFNALFRPWKGEISALTGHLAENDIRGDLSFIERALAIEKVRELYEQQEGTSISQRELSKRLKNDGYKISNSQISRMQDAVRYLLPAIPSLLYSGFGIDPSVRLIGLYKGANGAFEKYKSERTPLSFFDLFVETLNGFDDPSTPPDFKRILDELTGQMADALKVDYELLSLDIMEESSKSRTEDNTLVPSNEPNSTPIVTGGDAAPFNPGENDDAGGEGSTPTSAGPEVAPAEPKKRKSTSGSEDKEPAAKLQGPGAQSDTTWHILLQGEGAVELRANIAQAAREIVAAVGLPDHVLAVESGIGFVYERSESSIQLNECATATLMLLESLSKAYQVATKSPAGLEGANQVSDLIEREFSSRLGHLLLGTPAVVEDKNTSSERLSDAAVIKLFSLIRLARCLIDHEMDSSLGE